MNSVNIRQLKKNPSDALRMARKQPAVVMNRDQPEAALFHRDDEGLLGELAAFGEKISESEIESLVAEACAVISDARHCDR